jgi:hypothetical protein
VILARLVHAVGGRARAATTLSTTLARSPFPVAHTETFHERADFSERGDFERNFESERNFERNFERKRNYFERNFEHERNCEHDDFARARSQTLHTHASACDGAHGARDDAHRSRVSPCRTGAGRSPVEEASNLCDDIEELL